jgi:hypothetical protein
MSALPIRLVFGTRENPADFLARTALGKSIALYRIVEGLELRIFEENTLGLATVYNMAIDEAISDPAVLIFVRDDIHICDFHWASHLLSGLEMFEIVGAAGNVRRNSRQPTWQHLDEHLTMDAPGNLAGQIGLGNGFPCRSVAVYGEPYQQVRLLHDAMIACPSELLIDQGVYFDEQFDAHFHVMDFCRQAEALGLRMGTCPLSIVDQAPEASAAASWRDGYRRYLDKWSD